MTQFPSQIDCGDFEMIKLTQTFENATRLYELVDKNRGFLGRWLTWVDKTQQPEDEFNVLGLIERPNTPAYFIRVDGRIAGAIDAHNESVRDASIDLGYWLGHEFTGRGIMTRAARVMSGLLFDRGINRIVIQAATANTSSIAVATRLGFMREGILRAAQQIRPGEFYDLISFSKLKSEWEKDKNNA